MKNRYEIRGDITAIFLKRADGTILECLIDTEDLQKVNRHKSTWSSQYSPITKTYYVVGSVTRPSGKRERILLHRLITNAEKGLVVDHINHDTLNNTKSNLRVVTYKENNENRVETARNNTKLKGISWNRTVRKWQVKVTIDGEKKMVGQFSSYPEAREERLKYGVAEINNHNTLDAS